MTTTLEQRVGRWVSAATGGLRRAWTRAQLAGADSVGQRVAVRGRVWIRGSGTVVIGDDVVFDAETATIELHAASPDARIVIGNGVFLGAGTSIEAVQSITVGDRTRVGPFCKIMDNAFHRVVGDRTQRPASVEVTIGEDVDLGARTILLPGAHVGRGARASTGTVITRRIPEGATVAGVPAVITMHRAK